MLLEIATALFVQRFVFLAHLFRQTIGEPIFCGALFFALPCSSFARRSKIDNVSHDRFAGTKGIGLLVK
jgi:hypothetical protein